MKRENGKIRCVGADEEELKESHADKEVMCGPLYLTFWILV